ncbi:MAG: hypothetical protein HYZ34_02840 [Ignavibacteriae bacterium]|nr:hypothetical protein [Ignavibacteriota bacterium]
MNDNITITKSVSGKNIRLTYKQWYHIIESHDYMAGNLEKIVETIAQPESIVRGTVGELLAMKLFERTNITKKTCIVVYRENGDRFIITSFFTSEPERIKRKGIVWQK